VSYYRVYAGDCKGRVSAEQFERLQLTEPTRLKRNRDFSRYVTVARAYMVDGVSLSAAGELENVKAERARQMINAFIRENREPLWFIIKPHLRIA